VRLYNGCPDDELAAVWKSRADARAALDAASPGAFVTYFPMEGKYSACTKDYKDLGPFADSVEQAVAEALRILAGE